MIRVVIFYKTSRATSAPKNPYHTGGLAANALHTVGVLRRMGVDADLRAVVDLAGLEMFMSQNRDVTHAIIEAVWITSAQAFTLAERYPGTEFIVRAHSKIGFLQVEPEAIPVIRSLIFLRKFAPNLRFSSNNEEFAAALTEVYGDTLYLPNLYDLDESPSRSSTPAAPLRIASFGATRLLKLHPNAALAALQISRRLDRPMEFYINKDDTPGGHSVLNSIRNILADIPGISLIEVEWQDSSTFKHTISRMDLVIQLSCTETFCLVAADAVASGVPVVVGPAVTWLDEQHQIDIDDTSAVAELGVEAITERKVARRQLNDLEEFVEESQDIWSSFLHLPKKRNRWWPF